jgi:hypothetical protein
MNKALPYQYAHTAILCSGVTYPKVHRIYSLLEVYHRYSSLKQG